MGGMGGQLLAPKSPIASLALPNEFVLKGGQDMTGSGTSESGSANGGPTEVSRRRAARECKQQRVFDAILGDGDDDSDVFSHKSPVHRAVETEASHPVVHRIANRVHSFSEYVHGVLGMQPLKAMVNHPRFELSTAGVIVYNAIMMCLEMHYKGFNAGYLLRPDQFPRPGNQVWPWASTLFLVSEWMCNILFTVELFIRILAEPARAIRSAWIVFDFLIVMSAWLEVSGVLTLDPSILRLLRLFRLARVLKMIRLFAAFDALFLLIRSIKASVSVLLWSFVLLFFLQVSVGMFVLQFVQPYFLDDAVDVESRRTVFYYFGTFSMTMMTMFELTFGNWVVVTRILMDNIGEGWGAFMVVYRCMYCFAMIKVIAAVFITETTRIVAGDTEVAMMRKKRQIATEKNTIGEILGKIDDSGDGWLTMVELEKSFEDPLMATWAATLELTFEDLESIFSIIDEGDGYVTIDEFLNGALNMRGAAKQSVLATVLKFARRIDKRLDLVGVPEPLLGDGTIVPPPRSAI
jgi:hypothetical protein